MADEMTTPTGAQGADWADKKATEVVLDGMENGRLRGTIAAALREAERRGAERMRAAAANEADKHLELAIGNAILALPAAPPAERQDQTMSAEQLVGYAKRPAGAPVFAESASANKPEIEQTMINRMAVAGAAAYRNLQSEAPAWPTVARAMLAALREPTEAMRHAATMIVPTWDDETSAKKWRVMIDAALAEAWKG